MQYFKLVLLFFAYALITPASAQTCCPAGCVNDFNPNRCVTTGPVQRTCNPVPCAGASGSRGGSSGGTGSVVVYQRPPPPCFPLNTTKASRDAATDQCVSQLSGNAQFIGCLFEDDAGRAEDERTGLSCPARQAALAGQCRKRCADWAASLRTCISSDATWQQFFGDISGQQVGSARVDLCGPRLRDSFFRRAGRLPSQRFTP
jgi:hypothetical protein